MSSPAAALGVSDEQREVLSRIAKSRAAAHREVLRARVLLDAADGVGNKTIANTHDTSPVTVRAWRKAFEADGLATWGKVAPGADGNRRPATSRSPRSWS